MAEGASVVCSLGGDGTVRAVACALVGTETPLGILPAGTGNLLARNLDLPVALDEAVGAALTGRNRRIDVGELVIGELDAHGEPVDGGELVTEQFLVMGGMGLDALIMGGTNEVLKQRMGWAAYLLSGVKHLVSPGVPHPAPARLRARVQAARTGRRHRQLRPTARRPRAHARCPRGRRQARRRHRLSPGFVGWAPVIARVLTRQRKGHATLDHKVCREVRVRVDRPLPVQVDGDVVGEATEITASVRPAALTVRVPIA